MKAVSQKSTVVTHKLGATTSSSSIGDEIDCAWAEVNPLLTLAEKAWRLGNRIRVAQETRGSFFTKAEIDDAEKEIPEYREELLLISQEIMQTQGGVTELLEKQIRDAGWTISGLGDEMNVECKDPQKQDAAPMRQLLLMVAVNACHPATMDLALDLMRAMAKSHQIAHCTEWRSEESNAAVEAFYHLTNQFSGGDTVSAPDCGSAMATLIRCARFASPLTTFNHPEFHQLKSAESFIADGMNKKLLDARKLLDEGKEYEANRLLDSAAALLPYVPESVSVSRKMKGPFEAAFKRRRPYPSDV